jgi:protein-S-isoprenylcysteine O-methyltransferase Ste14
MYCPECRSEYREGFFECAECLVPLVASLSPEEPEPIPEYVDLEEVMTSFDTGEIAMARSILDYHQISYLVQGENFSTCYGSMPARIFVSKDKVNEAKGLLHDFL